MNKEIRTHKEERFHQNDLSKNNNDEHTHAHPIHSQSQISSSIIPDFFLVVCLIASILFLTKDVLCIILGLLSHIWPVQWTEKLKSLGCSCVHKWPLPTQIFLNKRKRVKKKKKGLWRREREM
jgi:hypothetical protein